MEHCQRKGTPCLSKVTSNSLKNLLTNAQKSYDIYLDIFGMHFTLAKVNHNDLVGVAICKIYKTIIPWRVRSHHVTNHRFRLNRHELHTFNFSFYY